MKKISLKNLRDKAVLVSVVLLLFANHAVAGDLRVGAAAVNLVADDSMVIAGGILPKKVKGQEGELRAIAVVIEKPGLAKVAIVACDVLFLPRSLVDPALAEIEKTTGIAADQILVNCTHTHHAPCTGTVHGYENDEVFEARVRQGIVKAVQEANAKLGKNDTANADFFFQLGEEKTVGANSRLRLKDGKIRWISSKDNELGPTGPFDPQLPVLAFRKDDKSLLATIYNHSTHTIGTVKGGVRSPSFYGLAAQELEGEIGGIVAFLEGASGSTHNITGVSTADAVIRMKDAVKLALKQSKKQSVPRLVSVKRSFSYEVRVFDEAVEDEKVVSYVTKYARPATAGPYIKVFRDMRKVLGPQQGQKRETWLQVMAIGDDVALVGVPAEYFTGLGVDIKKRSPFKYTVVAELANDWIGYLPDREAHKLGGYQTWMGLHSYAEVGTGEKIADEIVKMLGEIKN
ncbi:MAG: hypothetical protein GXP30_12700 [Verrucomicrobia bacterium]|nr:hypothetical protein [Verrucomicrobiota bacterium]